MEDFENEEQKNSWKKNKYIDYIKSKIQNISEKTEKEYKIEFLLHRFSLENTKENLEILDLFCENINFNLESIWWNLKQNFASWNYDIIKYFFENFEINTLEKFQNLSSLINCREKQNIKLIVEKLEIKDESELLEIIDVIRYTKLNLLEFFLNKDFVNSVYDLKKIEKVSEFLLESITLFMTPLVIGVIDKFHFFNGKFLQIFLILFVSVVVSIAITSFVTSFFVKIFVKGEQNADNN